MVSETRFKAKKKCDYVDSSDARLSCCGMLTMANVLATMLSCEKVNTYLVQYRRNRAINVLDKGNKGLERKVLIQMIYVYIFNKRYC
jgi:hypothetical protein